MKSIIDDKNLNKCFNKLKFLVLGSKTKKDAINIINKYNLNNQTYNIMINYINGKTYQHVLDNETVIKYINELMKCKYREDTYDIFNQITKKTYDNAQIKTFTRISNSKPNKPQYESLKDYHQKNKLKIITKKCPHCGHKCSSEKDTDYIVCGYTSSYGYDWDGCSRDWCFKCEKLLCKNWEKDQLYLPSNRFHNLKCCKKHAFITNKKFPDDYCNCNDNPYVYRNK